MPNVIELGKVFEQVLALAHVADEVEWIETVLVGFRRQRSVVFDDALEATIGVAGTEDDPGVAEFVLKAERELIEVLTPGSRSKCLPGVDGSTAKCL